MLFFKITDDFRTFTDFPPNIIKEINIQQEYGRELNPN